MRFSIIFLLALIFLGISCAKEHDLINIEEEPFIPRSNVEVSSLVVSVNIDTPFSCLVNGQVYTNEQSGVILIEKLLLEKEGNLILIKSEGYFDEIRYVIPSLGAHLYVEVDMTELVFKEYFNANEGGTISRNRLEIEVDANSIVDAQGNVYNGEVSAAIKNTFSGAFVTQIRKFPQNLLVENDALSMLHILDGNHIELRDEMMNSLFLRKDKSAKIKFKMPDPQQDQIPEILEMRYFNFENEKWEIIGTAQKVEEWWHGSINDLGMINWGIPFECRVAQIKLRTEDGKIVPNKFVWINADQETHLSLANSDSKGDIRIHVPLDMEFSLRTLQASSPYAQFQAYSIVGKGSEEIVQLEDFILTSKNYQNYNGNVIGCHGNILERSALVIKGIVDVSAPSEYTSYIFSDDNGLYDFALLKNLSSSFAVKTLDFNSNLLSTEYIIQNVDEQSVDFGNLLICEEFESYINYNIDGKHYTYAFDGAYFTTFSDPLYESIFTANAVSGAGENNRTTFAIEHNSDLQLNGAYDINNISIKLNDGQEVFSFMCNSDCNHSILVSRITADFYEGLIKYTDSSNSEVIIGAFRLPKQ